MYWKRIPDFGVKETKVFAKRKRLGAGSLLGRDIRRRSALRRAGGRRRHHRRGLRRHPVRDLLRRQAVAGHPEVPPRRAAARRGLRRADRAGIGKHGGEVGPWTRSRTIKQLKARYFRTMDTKDWDGMRRRVRRRRRDGHDRLGWRRDHRAPTSSWRSCSEPCSATSSRCTTVTCRRSSSRRRPRRRGIWAMEDMLR